MTGDSRLRAEIEAFFCVDGADQLAECGTDEELVDLFREGYLADQARHTRRLSVVLRTLIQHALPASSRLNEPTIFLTCGATVLHILRLGDSLAETRMLESLVGSSWIDLAQDIVGRLADPYALGRACATLLRTRPSSSESQAWSQRARETFELWLQSDCPESGIQAMVEITAAIGIELVDRWPIEIPGRVPDWSRLHGATSGAFIRQRRWGDPRLWEHLGQADSHSMPDLAVALIDWIQSSGADQIPILIQQLEALARARPNSGWQLLTAIFPVVEEEKGPAGQICSILCRQLVALSVKLWRLGPPSPDAIWAGHRLFGSWSAESRDLVDDALDERRVTLELAALAVSNVDGSGRVALVERFLDKMDNTTTWFRVATRLAVAASSFSPDLASPCLRRIVRHLGEGVPCAEDAACLLLAVRRLQPFRLRRTLRSIFVARPSAELLLALAQRLEETEVIDAVIEEVEGLALLTTESQLDSFRVRRQVLGVLAKSQLSGTEWVEEPDQVLGRLEAIRSHLLREEWAEMMDSIVPNIACAQRARLLAPLLGAEECRRSRALIDLRFDSVDGSLSLPPQVDPVDLVRKASTVARVEDELQALGVLVSVPLEIDATVKRLIEDVGDEEIRQMALLRYAKRAIRKEERVWGQTSDRRGVVLGVQRGVVSSSPRRLALLTPLLVDVGSRLGPRLAVAESIEGMLQLMNLESLSMNDRLEILETLIVSCVRFWVRESSDPSRIRALGCVVRKALRLPLAWPGSDDDRIPTEAAARMWSLVIACLEALPTCWQGGAAPWSHRMKRFLRRRQEPCWWIAELESFRLELDGRSSDLHRLLALCRANSEERWILARTRTTGRDMEGELLAAAITLLAPRDPDRAAQLLIRVPPGHRRDRLILNFTWLCNLRGDPGGEPMERVFALTTSEKTGLRIKLLAGNGSGGKNVAWWRHAMEWGALDPVDPEIEPLLVSLRDGSCRIPRAEFEQALITAASRGPGELEWALRLYLHFCLGNDQMGSHSSWRRFVEAVRLSRDLSWNSDVA